MISIAVDHDLRERQFLALADGTRARIVELLAVRPHTATEIHRAFPIAAPAVSRHLRVLREAGLIEQARADDDGRLRVYTLKPDPLRELAGWLDGVGQEWQAQLESFKDYVAFRVPAPAEDRG